MQTEDKLITMYEAVHGKVTGSCTLELTYNNEGEPDGVAVYKNGCVCWELSKLDLLFDYMTRDMKD